MQKGLLLLLTLMLLMPVSAKACLIEKTSTDEYYLYMWREPNRETYEGMAPIYNMFEDAGYDPELLYDPDWCTKVAKSSNNKILAIYSPIVTCIKPGDVKVTIHSDKGSKTNKLHIFDLKMNKVRKNSKKAVVKAKGNLKGCKVIIKIGKKTYRKKITKKNQKISFKISKAKAGKKISVRLMKGKKEIYSFQNVVR